MPAVFGQTFLSVHDKLAHQATINCLSCVEFEINLVWGSPCKYIETYPALSLTFEF